MQAVESDVNPGIDPLAVYLGLVPGFGLISFHYWNGRKQVGFHQGLPPSSHPSTPSFWDMYILRMSKKRHITYTHIFIYHLSLFLYAHLEISLRDAAKNMHPRVKLTMWKTGGFNRDINGGLFTSMLPGLVNVWRTGKSPCVFNGKIHYFDWAIFNSYFDITRGYIINFHKKTR